jgi:hypothetical protein
VLGGGEQDLAGASHQAGSLVQTEVGKAAQVVKEIAEIKAVQ